MQHSAVHHQTGSLQASREIKGERFGEGFEERFGEGFEERFGERFGERWREVERGLDSLERNGERCMMLPTQKQTVIETLTNDCSSRSE